MSTILVRGASGFVGSTLFAMAARGELDAQDRFLPLADGADLRQPAMLHDALKAEGYDAVIHLAPISFVPHSIEGPNETYNTNLHAPITLIDAQNAHPFSPAFLAATPR